MPNVRDGVLTTEDVDPRAVSAGRGTEERSREDRIKQQIREAANELTSLESDEPKSEDKAEQKPSEKKLLLQALEATAQIADEAIDARDDTFFEIEGERVLESALDALDSGDPTEAWEAANDLAETAPEQLDDLLDEWRESDPVAAAQWQQQQEAQEAYAENLRSVIEAQKAEVERAELAVERQRAQAAELAKLEKHDPERLERITPWAAELLIHYMNQNPDMSWDDMSPEEAVEMTRFFFNSGEELARAANEANLRSEIMAEAASSDAGLWRSLTEEEEYVPKVDVQPDYLRPKPRDEDIRAQLRRTTASSIGEEIDRAWKSYEEKRKSR